MEPVNPTPSLASRIKSSITAPFNSMLGTTETAGEASAGRFSNLFNDEKPVGSLPTHLKVDGLKTGDVTIPGARAGERTAAAGELPLEPIKVQPVHEAPVVRTPAPHVEAGGEPVKVPAHLEPPAAPIEPTAGPVKVPNPAKVEPNSSLQAATRHVEPVGAPVKEISPEVGQTRVVPGHDIPPAELPGQPVKVTTGHVEPLANPLAEHPPQVEKPLPQGKVVAGERPVIAANHEVAPPVTTGESVNVPGKVSEGVNVAGSKAIDHPPATIERDPAATAAGHNSLPVNDAPRAVEAVTAPGVEPRTSVAGEGGNLDTHATANHGANTINSHRSP